MLVPEVGAIVGPFPVTGISGRRADQQRSGGIGAGIEARVFADEETACGQS